MKKILQFLALLLALTACGRDKPYNEWANPKDDIAQAITAAQAQKSPVVLVFGANWCPDCRGLSEMLEKSPLAPKFAQEFKIVKINVGNFDTNLEVAKEYGNPIEIGIPGAAFLSSDGKLLHVAKAGDLSKAQREGDAGVYDFFKKMTQQ
jgi:protein disulfide-isomerase